MDKKKKINLYLTGFGPFGSVSKNPTMEIIEDYDAEWMKYIDGYEVTFKGKQIVDVDIDSANSALDRIQEVFEEHLYDGSNNLIVHLGVYAGSKAIHFEKQAVN